MPTDDSPPASQADLELEIAHILLLDIVGYSKLLANEQVESIQELSRAGGKPRLPCSALRTHELLIGLLQPSATLGD